MLPPEVWEDIRCRLDFGSRGQLRRASRFFGAMDPGFPATWLYFWETHRAAYWAFVQLMELHMNEWPQLHDANMTMMGTDLLIHWPYADISIYLNVNAGRDAAFKVNKSNAPLKDLSTRQWLWAQTSAHPPPDHLRG